MTLTVAKAPRRRLLSEREDSIVRGYRAPILSASLKRGPRPLNLRRLNQRLNINAVKNISVI